MKVPVGWLQEYVEIDADVQQLADALTFSGIEIEAIHRLGLTCTGVVAAEVREVTPHPNADKLRVCRVFDGNTEHQVVCGAPNVAAGGCYPFAPIGAVLDRGEFKIKKAKLRGVESAGMLCASDELGLSDDHGGLLDLPAGTEPGTPLETLYGEPETVFEVEITPNRPDCLSMIGVAREVAAVFGKTLKLPTPVVSESGEPVASSVTVAIESPEACPRYTARVIENVTIGPSPVWMQKRLELAGIRAINNLVDITNYVMLECGHPLHAFDYALVADGEIVVRQAKPGETMTTLDEVSRELSPEMLVIADRQKPIALAGVMGGAGSEIADTTRTVLLESACFTPGGIRSTARRLGMASESSYRFERGVDVNGVEWASRRAAQLMQELAGGQVRPGVVDVYPAPLEPRTVTCRYQRARTLIGTPDLADETIRDLLTAIGLTVTGGNDEACEVSVPTARLDLEREVDLIEEIARLHGLNQIEAKLSAATINPDADDRDARRVESIREHCVALGGHEIMNYSLVSADLLNQFGIPEPERVALPHPLTQDQAILRPSLVPQMVDTLGRNRARQIRHAVFFEISTVYAPAVSPEARPKETRTLSVGIMGMPEGQTLAPRLDPSASEMFGFIKGFWERLAEAEGLTDWKIALDDAPWWEPGLGIALRAGGEVIGRLGIIRKGIRKAWRLSDPIGVLEVALPSLIGEKDSLPTYRAIPQYPSVTRDIALVCDQSLPHETLVEVIWKHSPGTLEAVELFDLYEGDKIGAGKKSLAYSLIYRSAEGTLTDADANGYLESVGQVLRQELNIELRDR